MRAKFVLAFFFGIVRPMSSNSSSPIELGWHPLHSDVQMPRQMTPEAAGFDVAAYLPNGPLTLAPGQREAIPTGFALVIPPGFEGQIRPRSGWALRTGITVLNSPGTIDADYRGEVAIILVNQGQDVVQVEHRARIAQLVVAPVPAVRIVQVASLPSSERGRGGFGSTGL